jgi:hypothetical protein
MKAGLAVVADGDIAQRAQRADRRRLIATWKASLLGTIINPNRVIFACPCGAARVIVPRRKLCAVSVSREATHQPVMAGSMRDALHLVIELRAFPA